MNEIDTFPPMNDEERHLLFTQLLETPTFRHGEIIANYLSGTSDETRRKRESLEALLMFLRNKAPRMVRFFFPLELADKTLELLAKMSVKNDRRTKRKAKNNLTLEEIFQSQTNDFKADFKKIMNAKTHRSKTDTFQLTLHYFWDNKKDFPRKVKPLTQLFIKEFGNQMGTKNQDTLRRNLKPAESGIHIPEAISATFQKYIGRSIS